MEMQSLVLDHPVTCSLLRLHKSESSSYSKGATECIPLMIDGFEVRFCHLVCKSVIAESKLISQ